MVETQADMDRMGLCDAAHAIENEMYKHPDFDLLNPNEIPSDAVNILAMSIEILPE